MINKDLISVTYIFVYFHMFSEEGRECVSEKEGNRQGRERDRKNTEKQKEQIERQCFKILYFKKRT